MTNKNLYLSRAQLVAELGRCLNCKTQPCMNACPVNCNPREFIARAKEGDFAGAVEAIITALSLRDGFVPATINYRVPDEACDLDIVPNEGRKADIRCALSNSLGFGGHNATVALRKWEE